MKENDYITTIEEQPSPEDRDAEIDRSDTQRLDGPQGRAFVKDKDALTDARNRALRLELREELRQEIDKRVGIEKTLLTSQVRFATRVLASAATVISISFAFLGWKSWIDLVHRVDLEVAKRLEKHLSESPPARYEAAVEAIYDDVLLRSYLATIPRPLRLDRFPNTFEQTVRVDFSRLIARLVAPETDEFTAKQILRVLKHHGVYGISGEPARQLRAASLFKTPDRTARSRADLVRALTYTRDQEALAGVRRLLSDADVPTEVREAALEYIRELFAFEAVPDVETTVAKAGRQRNLEIAALRALAVLSPSSDRLASFLDRLAPDERPSQHDIYCGLAVVGELTPLGLSDQVLEYNQVIERREFGVKILRDIIQHEYHLESWSDGVALVFRSAATENQRVDLDLLTDHSMTEISGRLLQSLVASQDVATVHTLVSRFVVSDGIGSGPRLAPVIEFFNGDIVLDNGITVTGSDTTTGFYLIPAKDSLRLYWADPAGNRRYGRLASLDKLTFLAGWRFQAVPNWVYELSKGR